MAASSEHEFEGRVSGELSVEIFGCCCTSAFCHFPHEDYVQGSLLCVCLLCE